MAARPFTIRRADSLADLQWIVKQAVEEGWGERAREAEGYFTAGLTNNFLIGELHGEKICCISSIRHHEDLAVLGFYIVLKSFRGSGYGLKICNAALSELGDSCNAYFHATMSLREKYMSIGFQPGWVVRRYTFTVSNAKKNLLNCQLPPSVAKIVPAKGANFEELVQYGMDIVRSSQAWKSILAAWLAHAQESSWVAIGEAGEIVGYLILNETANLADEGYRAAPLFSDSCCIARCLLKTAVEFAVQTSAETIFLDIAPEFNSQGVSIMENELGAKAMIEFVFMTAKGTPNKPHDKAFGFASLETV